MFGKREMTREEMENLGFKDYRYCGNVPYHNVILRSAMILLFNQFVLLLQNLMKTNQNPSKKGTFITDTLNYECIAYVSVKVLQ